MKKRIMLAVWVLVVLKGPSVPARADDHSPFPGPDYGKIGRDYLKHSQDIVDRYFPNYREPPTSPRVDVLYGVWNASTRNAAGTAWSGVMQFTPNGRFYASAVGRTAGGTMLRRQWDGHFSYYANGDFVTASINPVQVKNCRLQWVDSNRFVLSEPDGSQTVFVRSR